MRREMLFLSVAVAGLVQIAPAFAQSSDQPAEADKAPVAVAPPAAAPAPAMPNEVHDKARDLAEQDLASAPAEEMKPVVVDPGDARRALARARQAAAEAQERAQQQAQQDAAPAPRPVVAAAEPAPRPAVATADAAPPPPPAAPVREARPVYAGDDRDPGYLPEDRGDDGARDDRDDRDGGRPVYADREEAAPVADADAEPEPEPAPRDLRGRQARQVYADDAAQPQPGRDMRERPSRQLRTDDAPAAAPLPRELPVRATRPVYADDDRDAGPADPGADSDAGYDRAPRNGERYAIVDRNLRPDARRDDGLDQPWANRAPDPACDADRADRLRSNVRRKADFERIDSRAAEDIEDEIGNAADLQRSYCASGMNDWREKRLDRLYAQIEDRIRYEEDRRWQR